MPTSSTYASAGYVNDGRSPAVDGDGFINPLMWKARVVAKTANYTVLANDSGTIFTNQGATAAVTFTLPATSGSNGLVYFFYNCEDQNLLVAAGTADTMTALNDVAADSVALSTTSLKIGGGWMVFGDGTSWHAAPMVNDTQTVTVATS